MNLAELWQRIAFFQCFLVTRKLWYRKDDRAMRPIHGVVKIIMTPWLRPRLVFPTFLWAFVPIHPINVPSKFEVRSLALPVPAIIEGTPKNWAAPRYAHVPFSPKFLMGFYSHWPCYVPAKFEVYGFTRSRDNRGYPKNLAQSLDMPMLHFLLNF